MSDARTAPESQDVIVSHNHIAGSDTPWSWQSAKYRDAADPRFRARYGFRDCESAANDATFRGHHVVEVRE